MLNLTDFKNQNIMVCGDLIADVYEYGIIKRMSREAPIPIVEFESEKLILGGAGNVVANIRSLQGNVVPVSILGKDLTGENVLNLLSSLNINTTGIISSPSIFTTTKRRVLAQGEHTVRQQILRLDRLPDKTLDDLTLSNLWDLCQEKIQQVKAVIISDYHLPLIPLSFLMELSETALNANKYVIVDSRHRMLEFRGVTLITPNRSEAEEALGTEIKTIDQLKKAGKFLQEKTESGLLLITLGDEGMALFESGKEMQLIPVYNRQEVFDVSGAGDTVVSAITLGLLSGMEPVTAAKFANIAAGLVVRKLGTATVSQEELLTEFQTKNIILD